MTDTAQGSGPAETVVASDPFADAAEAFKVSLGQAEPPEVLRDDKGRFASANQEIEAEKETPEGVEAEAESHEADEEQPEAAEEAQPEAVDLPTSWPSEHAEMWKSLPPETQALIVEREGQRDAAVNAKFQEAANVRKANEAVIMEANTNRQRFADAADFALSLIQPQEPPVSMLDRNSSDYDPDRYHLLNRQYQETGQYLINLKQQRDYALAQQQEENERAVMERLGEIEERFYPELVKAVPEIADPNKRAAVLGELAEYAVSQGIPEETFADPNRVKHLTSAEFNLVWKARQYDRMISAKDKVQPKAAKPAAPPVRPGVTTSRSAVEATRRKQNFERLDREGSIDAGAAIFKDYFRKG